MSLEPEDQGPEPPYQAIAERAYEIYLARGGQVGLAEEDWDKAAAELRAELAQEAARRRQDTDET